MTPITALICLFIIAASSMNSVKAADMPATQKFQHVATLELP